MSETTKKIIWKRHYDKTAHDKRMKRFYVFYLLPAAIGIVLMAIFKSIGEALGLLIVLGLFGLLLFGWIWIMGFNLRANPTIVEENGYLSCGKQKVPINEVTAFSTYMTSVSYSAIAVGSHTRSSMEIGCASFLLRDGQKIRFKWPALEKEQLDTLRVALEQVLPEKWTPIQTLRQDR